MFFLVIFQIFGDFWTCQGNIGDFGTYRYQEKDRNCQGKEGGEKKDKPKKDKNEDKDKQIASGYICVDVD